MQANEFIQHNKNRNTHSIKHLALIAMFSIIVKGKKSSGHYCFLSISLILNQLLCL